jgi:hypothetical protein
VLLVDAAGRGRARHVRRGRGARRPQGFVSRKATPHGCRSRGRSLSDLVRADLISKRGRAALSGTGGAAPSGTGRAALTFWSERGLHVGGGTFVSADPGVEAGGEREGDVGPEHGPRGQAGCETEQGDRNETVRVPGAADAPSAPRPLAVAPLPRS